MSLFCHVALKCSLWCIFRVIHLKNGGESNFNGISAWLSRVQSPVIFPRNRNYVGRWTNMSSKWWVQTFHGIWPNISIEIQAIVWVEMNLYGITSTTRWIHDTHVTNQNDISTTTNRTKKRQTYPTNIPFDVFSSCCFKCTPSHTHTHTLRTSRISYLLQPFIIVGWNLCQFMWNDTEHACIHSMCTRFFVL